MGDDAAPDAPIARELKRLIEESKLLRLENEMYEAFLQLHESKHGLIEHEDDAKKKKSNKKRGDVPATQTQPLTEDEKQEVATTTLEHLTQLIIHRTEAGNKEVDELHTYVEEAEEGLGEVRRWAMEFKRDVIIGGENPRTGRTCAEKVIRFLEDRLHEKQLLLEKLDLRHRTVKATVAKLEAQLAHEAEVGEVLHAVDFEQLQIENAQHSERIQQKNTELLQLKLTSSNTIQVLNTLKMQLSELTNSNEALVAQIAATKKELAAFEGEFSNTSSQCAVAQKTLTKLQEQSDNVEHPQILDYIKLKQVVCDLERNISDLKRKSEIAEMEGKRAASTLAQVKVVRKSGGPSLPGTGALGMSMRTR